MLLADIFPAFFWKQKKNLTLGIWDLAKKSPKQNKAGKKPEFDFPQSDSGWNLDVHDFPLFTVILFKFQHHNQMTEEKKKLKVESKSA